MSDGYIEIQGVVLTPASIEMIKHLQTEGIEAYLETIELLEDDIISEHAPSYYDDDKLRLNLLRELRLIKDTYQAFNYKKANG